LRCRSGVLLGAIIFLPALLLVLLLAALRWAPSLHAAGFATGSIQFTNTTASAGHQVRPFQGKQRHRDHPGGLRPGVCVADFDGDGFQDIYFVNGRDLYDRGISVRNALYRNKGTARLSMLPKRPVFPARATVLVASGEITTTTVFPICNVTQYAAMFYTHNNGNGTFTDVTDKAGVAGTQSGTLFHSGAHSLMYDRDGRLDLYVVGTLPWARTARATVTS